MKLHSTPTRHKVHDEFSIFRPVLGCLKLIMFQLCDYNVYETAHASLHVKFSNLKIKKPLSQLKEGQNEHTVSILNVQFN